MTRDDDGVSFDPKSWGNGAPPPSPEPARPAADDTSFDPKRWGSIAPASGVELGGAAATYNVRSWAGEAAPPPAPPAEMGAEPLQCEPRAGPAPRTLLVASASALLLVGGGVAAHLTGSRPVEVAVATPSTPATPSVASANASRRSLIVAGPADVTSTLASTGIAADAAAAAARAAIAALGSAPGDIRMVLDLVGLEDARRLTRLEATRDDGSGVVLTATADGFASEVRQAKLITEVKVVRGEMDATSFYNAAVTAGITDSLVSDFATAFAYDFDFQREVQPGDIFEAAFEQKVNPAGEAVGPPTLIYVSLQTAQKSKALYRFLAPGDAAPGWYDGNGRSTVTALMRTPVDGARISSQFGFRKHPVLGYQKLHKGTDFAAPIGTPIYAAGNGVIEFAGPRGAAGNFTVLVHDESGWRTWYMHQNAFAPGIGPGTRVRQGQQIGEVGNTGRSTGPHLHYEVRIDGEPVDPLSIATGTGKALTDTPLAAFRKERDRIDLSRASPVS